ncbi:MAG: FAD-dependent oxidoreductase, partial [Vampirovibrionales bacterium]
FRMFETQARYKSQYASIPPVKVKTAVIGNELESVIAAVAASKNGSVPVVLIRQEAPDVKLGGLITNSGQTHLDRDFNFQRLKKKAPGLYHEIISQAGTSDFGVDIDPKKLESVLEAYIKKHNIVLVNGEKDLALSFNPNYTRILNIGVDSQGRKQNFSVIHVIDTSPKGSVFERSGHWDYGTLKDLENYGTTLRKQGNDSGLLAVSAIPKINISYGDLNELDLRLRKQGVSFEGVSSTVKFEDLAPEVNASEKDSQKSHLVGKAIGSDFIRWMYTNHPKEAGRLKLSNIEGSHTSIQGFNLSEVESGKLNFNGILFLPDSIQELTSWNNKPNAEMLSLLNRFKEYLNLQTKKNLNLETPKQLYVREFGSHFATSQPVTLKSIVQPNNSDIFTSFQYVNDFRGQYPKEIMRGLVDGGLADKFFKLLKPVLQLGLNQGLSPRIDNLMGVSQSIGSTPSSQGIYRIQQNLSYFAELLGQRSALTKNPEVEQVNSLILQKNMQERGFKPYKINPPTYRERELNKALASERSLINGSPDTSSP